MEMNELKEINKLPINERVEKLKSMDWEAVYCKENLQLEEIMPSFKKILKLQNYRYDWCYKQIKKKFPTKDISILVVGSMTGVMDYKLLINGYNHVDSLDIESKTLERINTRLVDKDLKVNTIKCSVDDMNIIKDNTYDVVIACEVLEHIPDDNKSLKEIKRVTKDNGISLITVPMNDMVPSRMHIHVYDLYKICNLIGSSFKEYDVMEIHKYNKGLVHKKPNIFACIGYKR